jgi:acetyl-CoA carboxylase carboxyl transferase subunit alpha
LDRLRKELEQRRREVYSTLTPWQKTLVARNSNRPYTLDYVQALFTDFSEIHGDRRFGDDPAIVCGFAYYKEQPVAIVGHQKGQKCFDAYKATSDDAIQRCLLMEYLVSSL